MFAAPKARAVVDLINTFLIFAATIALAPLLMWRRDAMP